MLTPAELADKVADHLFVNGNGDKGDTLKMHDADGRYLGGWCRDAVRDAVLRQSALLAPLETGTGETFPAQVIIAVEAYDMTSHLNWTVRDGRVLVPSEISSPVQSGPAGKRGAV